MILKGFVCALILTPLAHAASTWPLQLEMRVPFEPTAYPSAGSSYLTYELYLTNFSSVPLMLRRVEVLTADSAAEGAIIGTHHTELKVLGPPVAGSNRLADDGPSNGEDNHHRRGVLVFQGRALVMRRYAIDWQSKNGKTFSGDAGDKRSYYAYGKPVLAVADSTVVTASDGLPDNVPGHNEGFHPAVTITPDTVFGNHIVLDLGGQQFATYCHLQPGSLRVKVGDHVRRGQVLAKVGNSGDAREPHVHFQVQTSSDPLAGEGAPYLIDHYRDKSADDVWHSHARELPLGGMLIDFGEPTPLSSGR